MNFLPVFGVLLALVLPVRAQSQALTPELSELGTTLYRDWVKLAVMMYPTVADAGAPINARARQIRQNLLNAHDPSSYDPSSVLSCVIEAARAFGVSAIDSDEIRQQYYILSHLEEAFESERNDYWAALSAQYADDEARRTASLDALREQKASRDAIDSLQNTLQQNAAMQQVLIEQQNDELRRLNYTLKR